MPSPNATFTELVSTTFRNHKNMLADNVTKHIALLREIMKSGNMVIEDGGTTITYPLEYAENSTYTRFSGYDVLPTSQSDVFTAAEYSWRNAAVFIGASGEEMRINAGKSQIIKLVKSRIGNAMKTFKNSISFDAYGDGTLSKQMNGLQSLVSDTGTGTVGGIVSGTYPFWQNKVQSAAAPLQGGGAITVSSTTIESLMLPLYLELTRGGDNPKLIVMSNDYYNFFEGSQVSLKRYMDDEDVAAGLMSIRYKAAKVFHDGGSGIPASHAYFLNTDYLKFVSHRDANMTLTDQIRPDNQDATGQYLLWMGNMITTNRGLQGVMKA